MKKTRIISMFLAVALVVSCFSVALAAAPVEFIFPGQKQELALGDWTGVIQSNPQNTPTVTNSGYLAVETTAYAQGVQITTTDSAYVLDNTKGYTFELKMRTAAAETSYYRAYCGSATSAMNGNHEVMPTGWVSSGFPVAGTDWVVVSGDVRNVENGQLAIKIHGGTVGGTNYGDSFDIDYVKVTEKETGDVFFYEDFEDSDFNCTYDGINPLAPANPASVSVEGISANNGGYLLISDRVDTYQGFTYTFDYTLEKDVTYKLEFDVTMACADDTLRFWLHDGASASAPEILGGANYAVANQYRGGFVFGTDTTRVSITVKPLAANTSGALTLKMHGSAAITADNDITIDNFVITNDGDKPAYECNFDVAEDANGWTAYTNVDYASTRDLPSLTLEGIAPYVAGNGYVHVGDRISAISGANYTSSVNLTGGETYTLKITMRASNADEYIRAFAYGSQFALTTLPNSWTELTASITPAADSPLTMYIHNGSNRPARYVHGFGTFDIDSLVVTDSTGTAVINETYDSGVGAWISHSDRSYAAFQNSTISHEVENDYATAPGSVATYTPAEAMNLKAGVYRVTGTFKVPFDRANLVVGRSYEANGSVALAPTMLIADNNKINVGVEIEDTEGNIYYAEENSVPVATAWVDVDFDVEIPSDVTVKRISFVGKDGVAPVAGTYAYGSETVTAGLLKDLFDAETDDDVLENSPMLVQIEKQDGTYQNQTYLKGNYATIAAADGFLAAKVLPFQFCNAEIEMIELMATEATDASPVGILAMLLLRRKMNDTPTGGDGTDNPEVVGDKYYLHVETTEYPQGIEFVTEDSAYILDESKAYTLEIKMRTTVASSYYRAYCGAGAPSKLSGDYEIKPENFVSGGFLVEGADWVVVTADVRNVVSGQLGIKIHGGAVSGATYGDSFDIDYIKVTEKGTDNVFFYEDFEDEEFNCTYNVINSAVGAAVKSK